MDTSCLLRDANNGFVQGGLFIRFVSLEIESRGTFTVCLKTRLSCLVSVL
jgi:hypothetical protein